MSGLSDATAANGVLDARHLDLLRRYRDAMRDLLSLSRAEYAPRPAKVGDPNEDNEDDEDDDRVSLETTTGPPLTPSSVLYASLVVAPTRRAFSWAVPTREALAAVERHSGGHLLEMGAGTGLWTALLRARGVIERVDAVDVAPCDGADINGHHAVFSTENVAAALANPPPFATVRVGTPEDARSWERTASSSDVSSNDDKNERGSERGSASTVPRRPSEFESESEPLAAPRALLLCWPPREERGRPGGCVADGAPRARALPGRRRSVRRGGARAGRRRGVTKRARRHRRARVPRRAPRGVATRRVRPAAPVAGRGGLADGVAAARAGPRGARAPGRSSLGCECSDL